MNPLTINNSDKKPRPYVRNGFGSVRSYLHGPTGIVAFLKEVFKVVELERNEGGPTALQIDDAIIWVEEGDLPETVSPWTSSVYVYVENVEDVFGKAIKHGAIEISLPEDKPYHERMAGFRDTGGNTWWVSTYKDRKDL